MNSEQRPSHLVAGINATSQALAMCALPQQATEQLVLAAPDAQLGVEQVNALLTAMVAQLEAALAHLTAAEAESAGAA